MGTRLTGMGKSTDKNMRLLIAPQVGREDIADSLGYKEYAGDPTGNVTPDFLGQWCANITAPTAILFYRAIGPTSADWVYNGDFGLGTVASGVTPGTVTASKALVVDGNKDLTALRQLNVTGTGAVASNQALGLTALASNTTGARDTAVGIGALNANTTGVDNTAVGNDALLLATAATGNTAVGSLAGDAITTGSNNTAVGLDALGGTTTGASNVGVGANALKSNTTGLNNTAVGKDALLTASIGTGNTAVGTTALDACTTGTDNTAVGLDALGANTTGINNTAVGKGALLVATTATGNVAVGNTAGDAITTGSNNVAVGLDALGANTTGANNVAVGQNALLVSVSGVRMTAVGATALDASLGVSLDNTAVGFDALGGNTTGIQNTAVGSGAGNTTTTGTNVTCIGFGAVASGATASQEVTIGNTSVTVARVQVAWTVLSDARDKDNVRDLDVGLDFIEKLHPVVYDWKTRNGDGLTGITCPGFLAQEVLALESAEGVRETLNLVRDENPDRLEWTPDKLMPVMVRAIQQLSARNRALEARLL